MIQTHNDYKAYEIINRPALAARIIGDKYNPPIYATYRANDGDAIKALEATYRVEALTLDSVFDNLISTRASVTYLGDNSAKVYISAVGAYTAYDLAITQALEHICSLWIAEAKLNALLLNEEDRVIYKTRALRARYYWTEEEANKAAQTLQERYERKYRRDWGPKRVLESETLSGDPFANKAIEPASIVSEAK
jgi:hypothetical protein